MHRNKQTNNKSHNGGVLDVGLEGLTGATESTLGKSAPSKAFKVPSLLLLIMHTPDPPYRVFEVRPYQKDLY